VVAEKFQELFSADERRWILAEFSQSFRIESAFQDFSREEIIRLAVKFGESLKLNEDLYETIRAMKARRKSGRNFDFEPSLDEARDAHHRQGTPLLLCTG